MKRPAVKKSYTKKQIREMLLAEAKARANITPFCVSPIQNVLAEARHEMKWSVRFGKIAAARPGAKAAA